MSEGNISQEFRLKNVVETRNYLIEEINRKELLSKKHKKVCATLNYIEHFRILASKITGCVSISAFSPIVGIPVVINNVLKEYNKMKEERSLTVRSSAVRKNYRRL